MNRAISRLFVVVILLFAILIFFTSRWTVFQQTALQHNSLNRLATYASWKVKRGEILADDGTVLAKSVPASGGIWTRTYPEGPLFAQAVGYADVLEGEQTGLEASQASVLEGQSTGFNSLLGLTSTDSSVGDDVHTTLDPRAQKLARQLLNGMISRTGATSGSVVAIVPQTGAVKVMYSTPTYNDNNGASDCTAGCSLLNYATQAGFAPGSTFKLVTTTAALDTGKYTPDSIINGDSPITLSGIPFYNDAGESYGDVTLTEGLTYSINTVYAQVGEAVGAKTLQKYMERFGFYSVPPLDYPSDEMIASGERIPIKGSSTERLVPVTNPNIDVGRTAIGQANLSVTPFQMAEVVSTIANDGTLMVPYLVSKVVNPDGQVVDDVKPTVEDHVMSTKVAAELQSMMRDVVEEGTGETVNFPGLPLAGKTGTASTGAYNKDDQPYDNAWFLGFPSNDPKIAVAVELSNILNGYGGTYAAPIALSIIKKLVAEGY